MSNNKQLNFGYLHVDHRNSPGLPEDVARYCGYDPEQCKEGRVFEVDTMGCKHCGGHVIPNPWRVRDRPWCRSCDAYICDPCDLARKMTGYEHTTIDQVVDRVAAGKWAISGESMSRPLLVPVT